MVWRLHAELGKAFCARGQRKQAGAEFSSARTVIEEIAAGLPDGGLRDNFVKRALAGPPAAPTLTSRQATMREFGGLTEREREVVSLIAQGKSNREIAESLVITVRTVETHVTRILEKLGLKSRAKLAVWAHAQGLPHAPD